MSAVNYRENLREATQVYDNHTLNLQTPNLTRDQVIEALEKLLQNIKETHKIATPYHINYVYRFNRDNGALEHSGVCFVFVKDSRVYHMILGRNPDGTDRVETKPDPDWVPPTEKDIEVSFDFSSGMGWGDMMVELEQQTLEKTAPLIRIQLPSLVPTMVVQTQDGPVEINAQASFEKISDELMDNFDLKTLYAVVDNNVKDAKLFPFLSGFSNSKGYPKFETRPINNTNTRGIKVRFDPNSYDAMFCRQSIMIINLLGDNGKVYKTKFNYFRKRPYTKK